MSKPSSVNILAEEIVNEQEGQRLRCLLDDAEFCRRLTELIFSADIPVQ